MKKEQKWQWRLGFRMNAWEKILVYVDMVVHDVFSVNVLVHWLCKVSDFDSRFSIDEDEVFPFFSTHVPICLFFSFLFNLRYIRVELIN